MHSMSCDGWTGESADKVKVKVDVKVEVEAEVEVGSGRVVRRLRPEL